MNNVNNMEAARVMNVLEEAATNVRLMSKITPALLDQAEELADHFPMEFTKALVNHRNALGDPAATKETTLRICRLAMGHASDLAELDMFAPERSPAMSQFLNTIELVYETMQKKLSTTVEEETAIRENFEQVKTREKKAVKEKGALEHELEVERAMRAKQLSQMQEAERRIKDELATVKSTADAKNAELDREATEAREFEGNEYTDKESALQAKLVALKNSLADIQKEHKEEEAALRKKKSDNEKKLQERLQEYDTEMGGIEKQLNDEKALYDEAKKQLTEYEQHYQALRKEAEEAAAVEKKRREAKEKEEAMQQMLDNAALSIQKAWKTHKEATAPPPSAGKKGKGKGKKK